MFLNPTSWSCRLCISNPPTLAPHAFAPHEPFSSKGFHRVQCQGEPAAIYFQIRIQGFEGFHTVPKKIEKKPSEKKDLTGIGGLHLDLQQVHRLAGYTLARFPNPPSQPGNMTFIPPLSFQTFAFMLSHFTLSLSNFLFDTFNLTHSLRYFHLTSYALTPISVSSLATDYPQESVSSSPAIIIHPLPWHWRRVRKENFENCVSLVEREYRTEFAR